MLSAQTSVKGVVDAYFKAIGGVDLVEQVETFYAISETEINGAELAIYNKQQKPNLRSIVIHKDGKFISKKVYNGITGYQKVGGVKKIYTSSEIKQKLDRLFIFPEYYYLKKATFLGKKEVMGRICNVLGLGDKRIYYDVLTGLKLKASSFKQINGKQILQETYYIDYKDVKGIKFPVVFKSIIKDKEIVYITKSISLNRDVSMVDFE